MQVSSESAPREASKLITCVLPDDGSHKLLLEALHREKNITRAEAVSCLGMSSLADANKVGWLARFFDSPLFPF